MITKAKEAHYDLLIIVPLEEEFLELQKVFPHKVDLTTDGCFTAEVETNCDVSAVVVVQEEMGKSAASAAIDEALGRFETNLVVCLGIAGAISKDLSLCDVCYSGNILDVHENSKASDGTDGMNIALSPTHYKSPKAISSSFDYVRRLPNLQSLYGNWQEKSLELLNKKITGEIPGRNNKTEELGKPKSMKGTIACGVVSASEAYNKKLTDLDRKVLAIETEAGGIFARTELRGLPAISIRGISDYADQSKGRLEGATAGIIREIAARNAATFLHLQLKNPNFVNKIKLGKHQKSNEVGISTDVVALGVPKLVETLSERIEGRLGDLSPEYKLLPKGFVLPLPRIRAIGNRIGQNQDQPLVEIIDSLRADDKVYLALGPSYPERSLAWLIADELIQSEMDGKQIIPIVVEGDQVRPPKFGIEYAAPDEIAQISGDIDFQPVIVFDGLPLHSQSRMKFLIEQIEIHKNAKFLFVDRSSSNLFFEGEFEAALQAKPYEVCAISFSQMSHFVQKNFEMNSSEADVIALRLRNTFEKFDLSAHPSYFAGIPRSTLASLIQANRRAELMELAVVGFMSFVVADDRADIQLSRSTRTRFLQKLVVELWVEKREFNEANLISFVSEFAKEFDFEIKPIAFIKGFLDSGILHFEAERARVSLPFIEHYLLASALSDDVELANRYFDVNSSGFDYATFDLYAEIGPSEELVDKLLQHLAEAIDACSSQATSSDPVLWSSEIESLLKVSKVKINNLQKQIDDAIKSINNGAINTEEKQQILDASDAVNKSVAQKKSLESKSARKTKPKPMNDIGHLAKTWTIGTYLLGSGAEHLDANRKRRLAALSTNGAETIIDDWTSHNLSMDFSELKSELTSDENIAKFMEQSPSDRSAEEVKKLFLDIFNTVQHMALAMPFHRILDFLCEHARGAVLATSVKQFDVNSDFQSIIRAIWLTDISVSKGKPEMGEAMKLIPNAPFFRLCFATHFLTRVYWSHALQSDRLAMLDYSDAVLKPTNLKIGKDELKRMIEREGKQKKPTE